MITDLYFISAYYFSGVNSSAINGIELRFSVEGGGGDND